MQANVFVPDERFQERPEANAIRRSEGNKHELLEYIVLRAHKLINYSRVFTLDSPYL